MAPLNSIMSQKFARHLEIPYWMRVLSQEFIDKNTNECGSGWNAKFVPDCFWSLTNSNLPVGGLCRIHDLDYWDIKDLLNKGLITHKQAESMRFDADNRLKANFEILINCQYEEDIEDGSWCLWFWTSDLWRAKRARSKRKVWAEEYYYFVREFGGSAIE